MTRKWIVDFSQRLRAQTFSVPGETLPTPSLSRRAPRSERLRPLPVQFIVSTRPSHRRSHPATHWRHAHDSAPRRGADGRNASRGPLSRHRPPPLARLSRPPAPIATPQPRGSAVGAGALLPRRAPRGHSEGAHWGGSCSGAPGPARTEKARTGRATALFRCDT